MSDFSLPKRRHPTTEMLIKQIVKDSDAIPSEGIYNDEDLTEIDSLVIGALEDLLIKPQKFYPKPDNPSLIECPKARFLRIADEIIKDQKETTFFRQVMEMTKDGKSLKSATDRSLKMHQDYLDIATAFKDFIKKEYPKTDNFMKLKHLFRIKLAQQDTQPSDTKIDDALAAYDINWGSYSIDNPRKDKRKK